ncbi:ribonuclease R [bacterium]|nr:ribonuclease R [bacterium]
MNAAKQVEKLILELVLSDNYQPLKPKAIAKKLKLLDEEREVKRTIKRLIKKGRLAYGPKHLVIRGKQKPQAANNRSTKTEAREKEITGRFRKNSGGFGFVTPENSVATDRSDDIFIPKSKTSDASDRDIVKIRISKSREKSRTRVSGQIIDVVQRHTHRFVGTYRITGSMGFVDVDGGVFESGILVGDAGAKNCKVDDKVVIEIANFPSINQPGEGVISEVLGDRGSPGVDTLSIIRQYDLPDDFPESVLEEARSQAEEFNESIGNRTDFTKTTVITIDPKTARDFDDAISLEKLDNGHWQLGVHIADVSHFVPLNSELDTEAFQRATSIYLPDRVIPMLPEVISNNLASLQPNRVRYCMTALIEFTPDGIPIQTELHRGAIESDHRFTYEEIDDYLADDEPWKQKLPNEVFELVRNMHTLAMTLRRRRMKAGAINLILPEVKIDLDEDGKVVGAHTVDNTESHQVIEEFMLAGNEAVAQKMADKKLFYMRRVHPHPSEQKLNQLTEFVQQLGIQCESLKSRFEVKRVIEESENLPEQHAIHYAVLRSMQKAVYSPEEIGHYALNSENYCHFTSPIRRYPDLIIHRMVGDIIDGKKPDANFERLAMLGNHCSDLEKRATEAERDLIKLKLLNFMAGKIGHTMSAVITGVESFGIFAQGIEIPAEGMIPVDKLPPDTYQYDRNIRTLAGFREGNEYRLGDKIEVRVTKVDPDARNLEFEIPTTESSSNPRAERPQKTERPPRGNRSRRNNLSARDSNSDDWEKTRANGPQKGHNKKRQARDVEAEQNRSKSSSRKKKKSTTGSGKNKSKLKTKAKLKNKTKSKNKSKTVKPKSADSKKRAKRKRS